MSLLAKAKPITEIDPWLHFTIYGPPGGGKTKLCCELPNCLLLDADGTGSLTLAGWPELRERVSVLRVRTQEEMMEVIQELRKSEHTYKTLVIDTASQLQLNDIMAYGKDRFLRKPQQQDKARLSKYTLFQSDYGESTQRMRDVFVQAFDLPMHVAVVCHSMETKDEGDNTIYIRPALTPKLQGTLAGLADLTGYLTLEVDMAGKEERVLRVKPTRRIAAKTRIRMPNATITEPTGSQLLEARLAIVKAIADQEKVSA